MLVSDRPSRTLDALPPAPQDRSGWPWTEAAEPLPERMPSGRPWPRVTVVTPSYNQAQFLEATIRSVLLQGYPDLEYFVLDGGSTDGSREIVERYAPWLDRWVSEPDGGQSDAINRGFRRASGRILVWLNSDDIHYPGALATAAREMDRTGAELFLGAMDKVRYDDEGREERLGRSFSTEGERFHAFPIFADGRTHDFHFIQPPAFWTRDLWERVGELDDRYHYQMDREWVSRALAAGARVATSDAALARFTLHPGSKSEDFMHRFHRERVRLYLELASRPGFRRAYCWMSAVEPARRVLGHRATRLAAEGRVVRGLALRLAGGLLSVLQVLLRPLQLRPRMLERTERDGRPLRDR